MKDMKKRNVVIAQSGGPTMVINQSLVGAVMELRKNARFGKILGARHGILGILGDDFVDLRKVSETRLKVIASTPSSALGSCRKKPDAADCKAIFEAFRKRDVGYFFYIGGNDSADAAKYTRSVPKEHIAKNGHDVTAAFVAYARPIVGDLPKTDVLD